MTAIRPTRPTIDVDPTARSLVLFQDDAKRAFNLGPLRRRDSVLAWLLHTRLDRRLAAGEASHHSRLLAVRAAQLVSTCSRERFASRWDGISITARRAAARGSRFGAGPSRTGMEAVDLADSVAAALRSERLVPAQGVALAARTLGTAATASFWLGAGGDDVLAAAARTVLSGLDPAGYPASSSASAA